MNAEDQRKLLDVAQVIGRDMEDRIILWTRGAEDLYGWSREEAVGRVAQELLQTIFPETLESLKTCVSRDGCWKGEITQMTRDGRRLVVASHWILQRDEQGRPLAIFEVNNDLAQKRCYEEELFASRQMLRTILDTIPQRVFWKDRNSVYLGCNKPLAEDCGYTDPAEIIGRTDYETSSAQIAEIYRADDREVMRTGEPKLGYEEPQIRKDGTHAWLRTSKAPLRDHEGRVIGVMGTYEDITEQKLAREELERSKELLARMNKNLEGIVNERTARLRETVEDLERFSYSITHDMRGPLRAIHSFLSLLEERIGRSLSDVDLDYFLRVKEAASRMDQLIQDSLNYNKTLRQEFPLHPVEVSGLLRGLVESYPNLQAPEALIQIEPKEKFVLGNEAGLIQCFSNLLGNAVKFVPRGTRPHVRVWTEERDASLRVWIEDNGIGIPEAEQERIFEMFERLHNAEEYPGTGIGLTIARKAVQRMGGQLGLISHPGQGSRFWVELKAAKAGRKQDSDKSAQDTAKR